MVCWLLATIESSPKCYNKQELQRRGLPGFVQAALSMSMLQSHYQTPLPPPRLCCCFFCHAAAASCVWRSCVGSCCSGLTRIRKPAPASAYGDDREKVTTMAGSAFRMYLFSRLRNLLLLHICFQTLAGKKNTPEKAPPSTLKAKECSRCSSSQKTRSQQDHRRNNERRKKTSAKRAKDCSLRRNQPKTEYREKSKRVFSKRKLATHREEQR